MKIKIIALLLVAVISMLSLASCGDKDGSGNDGGKECQHTFSEAWASDKNKHWHQATCEHGEIKDSEGYHLDTDEDSKCDVCEYNVPHTHKFASTWSYSELYHWKEATCTHTDQKSEYALHSDTNEDCKCDVCEGHVHIAGASGFCKGCGEPMTEIDQNDFKEIISAVVNQGGLVNGATIEYNQNIPSNNSDYYNSEQKLWMSYNRTTKQNISVLFGKNGYVHILNESTTTTGKTPEHHVVTNSKFESWYEKDGSNAFGVASENDEQVRIISVSTDNLLGNLYTLSTVASGYGTESFLYSLYEASQSAGARDFEVKTADKNISFTFNILSVNKIEGTDVSVTPSEGETEDPVQSGNKTTVYNVYYYEIEVSFTYDDRYVITSLYANCKAYTNQAGQLNDKTPNYKDVNIKYDEKTGKFDFVKYDESYTSADNDHYKVVDKSEVNPSVYSYSVTQTVGERTADNEHSKESFTPKSFNIYSDVERTAKLGGTIETNDLEFVNIYLDHSIDYVYDLIGYKVLDANGNELKGTDIMEGDSEIFRASLTYGAEEGRYFMLFPKKAGNYTLVITYQGKIVHQVSIIVK